MTGEQVGLRLNITSFGDRSWMSCTSTECSASTCPGRLLRQADVAKCPNNIFRLRKIIGQEEAVDEQYRPTGVVRVGDPIVLEKMPVISAEGASGTNEVSYVSCNQATRVCSLSGPCEISSNKYGNTEYCRENVLVVRATGKVKGDAITHKDSIGFEFQTAHNDFFDDRCALGCDPVTKVCKKKRCVFTSSNSLTFGLDETPTEKAPKCGMDLFSIFKL